MSICNLNMTVRCDTEMALSKTSGHISQLLHCFISRLTPISAANKPKIYIKYFVLNSN